MKFLHFLLFLWAIFVILDQDQADQIQCGSGSETLEDTVPSLLLRPAGIYLSFLTNTFGCQRKQVLGVSICRFYSVRMDIRRQPVTYFAWRCSFQSSVADPCVLLFEGTFTSFFKVKSQKEVT
jgi:hypothetical protein